ncbi:hypothetical protein [Spiroplasma endosymbiont of Nebria brevicollis]|uniref:hypothetical protein n=1 Tax=Spiroplasma endosymbiont of Nebria brevicollis TaxID=3066284 RepID=UPI00313DD5F6
MNLTVYLLSGIIGGAVTSGVIITFVLSIISKKIKKNKQDIVAKELKFNKLIEYIILNIKQLNDRLQLTETPIAQKLDAFDVDEKDFEDFIIAQKAKRQELTNKDKKKVTKIKI